MHECEDTREPIYTRDDDTTMSTTPEHLSTSDPLKREDGEFLLSLTCHTVVDGAGVWFCDRVGAEVTFTQVSSHKRPLLL